MRYRELKIETGREDLDAVIAELAGGGFDSLMIDDPDDAREILDDPGKYKYDYYNEEIARDLDRRPVITLYLGCDEEGAAGLQKAEELLRRAEEGGADLSYEVNTTGDDSEWLYKWQENFRPVRVGERIVVKPSWESYEPAGDDLVIEMDPGMAFGSGLHETTSMCIKALEKYMPEGAAVLDVGTGTGILAIAAALLGASGCLGIDIDDEAVRVGSENTARNGLADKIDIIKGDLTEGVDYKADVIAANLMADLVMRLSPAAAEHIREGGIYITSGILDIKEDIVRDAVEKAGFEVLETIADGEWRAIVARRGRA